MSSSSEGSNDKKAGLRAAVRKAMIIDKLAQGPKSTNPGITSLCFQMAHVEAEEYSVFGMLVWRQFHH